MTNREAILTLNLLPGIGPVRITRLLESFGRAEAVLTAGANRLQRVDGIGPETAKLIAGWEDHADPFKELQEAKERGIAIVTQDDDSYPKHLLQAYDAPILLYVWGEILPRDKHAISVVGSRRTTSYGVNATKKLTYQLAHAGFTIVSGLARGIDTAAHEAALAAKGRTIAVIGSGLGKLYPPENLLLAEKIANGQGAVISEFPLHRSPDKQTFPMRNRIVAAWCQAVLVTECPAWSGSLITANLASEYGKPIFAVPGQIDKPSSAGCHQLIRDGATLVADASHIIDDMGELPFSGRMDAGPEKASELPELPTEELAVYSAMGEGDEMPVDRLIQVTGLPSSAVTAALLKLELRRLIRPLPGFRFIKR
ncbi:DNA-processing protein DprA [Luteolibacter sp. AS25]|uniref:DNA-processing protein DprA n=1 Tax=Luteolibacter sp. AS25 TaxID=3135776 RepID=UPI00398AE5A5